MRIKMEVCFIGVWTEVNIQDHYNFPCPIHGNNDKHGFIIEPFINELDIFGLDYKEGVMHCGVDGCPATMPYRLSRVED